MFSLNRELGQPDMTDLGLCVGREQVRTLLEKYFRPVAEERLAWQIRVMELPGCDFKDLTKLHGVLIAQGWVEQQNLFGEGATALAEVATGVPDYRGRCPGYQGISDAR